jgi:hypothetical protein
LWRNRIGKLIGQCPKPERVASAHDDWLPRGGEKESRLRIDVSFSGHRVSAPGAWLSQRSVPLRDGGVKFAQGAAAVVRGLEEPPQLVLENLTSISH